MYPYAERHDSGHVPTLVSIYGDPDMRYTTVNCFLVTQQPAMCNEQSHILMR